MRLFMICECIYKSSSKHIILVIVILSRSTTGAIALSSDSDEAHEDLVAEKRLLDELQTLRRKMRRKNENQRKFVIDLTMKSEQHQCHAFNYMCRSTGASRGRGARARGAIRSGTRGTM